MNRTDRRKVKKGVDKLALKYDCPACGTQVAVIPVGFAKKKPKAAQQMLSSGQTRHNARTGCRGVEGKVRTP